MFSWFVAPLLTKSTLVKLLLIITSASRFLWSGSDTLAWVKASVSAPPPKEVQSPKQLGLRDTARLVATSASRFLRSRTATNEPPPVEQLRSKMPSSKLALRDTARRLRACLSGDDINIENYVSATSDFISGVESFGDFTSRGVDDARQNLKRVSQASGGRIKSMRALLLSELSKGALRPGGGPASRSAAEALQWSRLNLSLWVEIFREHCRTRASLPEATRHGFKHTLARYLDRFSRAAFNAASKGTPDWDEIRQRTHLGCHDGVCSEAALARELGHIVKDVEPVIHRMTELQKSLGLEDPRTP